MRRSSFCRPDCWAALLAVVAMRRCSSEDCLLPSSASSHFRQSTSLSEIISRFFVPEYM